MRMAIPVLLLSAVFSAVSVAAPAADPPANQWTTVEGMTGRIYQFARPIYVPPRNALCQWSLPGKTLNWFDLDARTWQQETPANVAEGPHKMIDVLVRKLGYDWKAGGVLKRGRYQSTLAGAVWDSKRKRLIFNLNRLMVSYDPAAKTWHNLEAKSIINGTEYPGSPPVFGTGACYDPVNDEIVVFPHWTMHSRGGRHAPKNYDRRTIDGTISNHLGTLRYRFEDNTWRRVSDTFGSPEVKAARQGVFAVMKAVSDASDRAYALNGGRGEAAGVAEAFVEGARALKAVAVPETARPTISAAARELDAAAAAAAKKAWLDAVRAAGRAMWTLNRDVIDGTLAVEPPPRCGAPMVYHERLKAIVMFGGRDGLVRTDIRRSSGPRALNDTWLYDCATREWSEVKTDRRPPGKDRPALFYDPKTAQCLLVDFERGDWRRKTPGKYRLWSLDVAKGEWSLRDEQDWTDDLPMSRERGSGGPKSYTPLYELGYDPARQTLLMLSPPEKKKPFAVKVLQLDLSALAAEPAPVWQPGPPIKPPSVPPDDPEWVAKLKSLPANQWVDAQPKGREPNQRGWGGVAGDPVRGHLYYFGGGHSSYQVNDVAIYAVGANKWTHGVGDHNDFVPPTNWGGVAMGYRGGTHAHHMRNQYVAVDGRMFVNVDVPWFYDLDRGGVWRQRLLDKREKEEKAPDDAGVHVTTPDGRVLSLMGQNNVARMASMYRGRSGFASYDAYANTLTMRNVSEPFPNKVGESRPLCHVAGRDQIFFYEHVGDRETLKVQRTWVFDIGTNKWIDLKPKKSPFDGPGFVILAEHVPDQDAVWVVLHNRLQKKRTEYWVYSFKRNTWTRMAEKGLDVSSPYGQAAYIAKYGVIVNVCRRTRVMRPDFSQLDWE